MSDEPSEEDLERADRIGSGRRSRRTDRASRTSETAQTEEAAQSSGTSQTDQTSQSSETGDDAGEGGEVRAPGEVPLKERTHATFYYVDDLADELEFSLQETNLRIAREYGQEATLEKNRHFRPLVLRLGLEALDELDVDEIRERLSEDDVLDEPPGVDE